MHYGELFRAIDWFRQDTYAYDSAYVRSRKATEWKKLHKFSDDEIARKVLGFLNEWRCRIGITTEVITGIREAFSEILSHLGALEGETLWDVNFGRLVLVDSVEHNISFIIYFAMNRMINVGYRFRHVAASKLLHMVNPELFAMWDNSIIRGYNLSPDAHSYTYSFMPVMQKEANEAIESYIKDYKCNRKQAVEKICSYGEGKTLAKLVDEFNYWRFSSGAHSGYTPRSTEKRIRKIELSRYSGR